MACCPGSEVLVTVFDPVLGSVSSSRRANASASAELIVSASGLEQVAARLGGRARERGRRSGTLVVAPNARSAPAALLAAAAAQPAGGAEPGEGAAGCCVAGGVCAAAVRRLLRRLPSRPRRPPAPPLPQSARAAAGGRGRAGLALGREQ